MIIRKIILMAMLFTTTLALVGWGKAAAKYGEAIPNNVEVVKLKEILKNPQKYRDKEVVLEGNFGGACCASDFKYKEGLDLVEVYPKGFSNPKLVIGKPVRIYGIVRTIEKKAGYEFYIEAKEVEVR